MLHNIIYINLKMFKLFKNHKRYCKNFLCLSLCLHTFTDNFMLYLFMYMCMHMNIYIYIN